MKKVIENWIIDEYRNMPGIYHLWITEKHHYVGSAVNLAKRLLRHRADLIRRIHDNSIMQRCFDKYGYDLLKWEVLEVCTKDISYKELLVREKHFIDLLNPDMNIKRDPVTQQGCPTTSKRVFQFNQFGELIDEWDCISEAARRCNVDVSGIIVACKRRNKQRVCANSLWDYEPIYSGKLNIIYTYDLNGNFLDRFYNTKSIYEKYFNDISRKTVLSQLKKKIDSNIPYKNIYLSTNPNFKIDLNYKPKYKELDEISKQLSNNPMVYKFNKDGVLLDKRLFREWPHYSNFIRKQIRNSIEGKKSSICYYSLDSNFKPPRFSNYNDVKVEVTNCDTGEVKKYESIKDAVYSIFTGTPKELDSYYKNTRKHMSRGTKYKNYLFKRDL